MTIVDALVAPRFRSARFRWAALVAYGALFALYTVSNLDAGLPAPHGMYLQGDRLHSARLGIRDLSKPGGSPLIGELNGSHYVIGLADDPGWYLYDSYLSHATGQTEPRVVLRWAYIALFALLIAVLPFSFLALTGSWAAAVLAPLIVHLQFRFLDNTDIYWVNGWAVVLLLPVVFATYARRWTGWSIAVLVSTAAIASWATSIRLHAGLPVAIGGVVIALLKERRWWRKVAVAAAVLVAYLSVYPLAFTAVFHARDAAAKRVNASPPTPPGVSVSDLYPQTHLTWHNAYIGLGYVHNRFGIRWDDAVGLHHAQRFDPNVRFLSKRYDRDERHLFFTVLRKDPGLVWKNLELKTRFEVGQAMRRFGWALLLLPPIFGFGRSRRRELGLYLLLTVPALALTLAPPILGVPILFYSVGFYAAAGFVWLLTATWFVGVAGPEIIRDLRTRFAGRSRPDVLARIQRRDVLALAGIALALVAIALRPPIRYAGISAAEAAPALPTTPLAAAGTLAGKPTKEWPFGARLPGGWTEADPGVAISSTQGGMTVVTTDQRFGYQLTGPDISLPRGRYRLELRGVVADGGLDLGVLDAAKNVWIAQTGYSSEQHFAGRAMVTRFTLSEATKIRPILANWRPVDRSSTWRLVGAYLVPER